MAVDIKAAADVLAERQRQIMQEGWEPSHDDEHGGGELALAAASYAHIASVPVESRNPAGIPPMWPWSPEWWKPTTPRRDLVKAAALILAEIERLDRAASREDV